MENKKVIYLDFDSTIVNSEKAFCAAYNIKFQNYTAFEPADWHKANDWVFKEACPLLHELYVDGLSEVKAIFGSDDFFSNLEFYDHAERVIERLTLKYDVVICTSATPANAAKKVLWIEERIPAIKEVLIVINRHKNGTGKGRVHMIEDNAIFIDDHPENLMSTKASEKYLFKNRETDFNQGWQGKSFANWLEIESTLLTSIVTY